MGLGQGIFAVKLYELEQQFGRLQSRLHICQQEQRGKIQEELARIGDECKEAGLTLKAQVENGHSPAVEALSAAQIRYYNEIKTIMDDKISQFMRTEKGDAAEEKAEAMTLYAEYAIDFAVLSMKHALFSAMYALDMQLALEQRN